VAATKAISFVFRWSCVIFSLLLSGCSSVEVTKDSSGRLRVEGVTDPGYLFPHDNRMRSYYLHLPRGYDAHKSYPLVLVLHSAMGNGSLIAERTHFNSVADAEGFIVVYPNGSSDSDGALRMLTWNAGHCCYLARDQKIDDVGFISGLIEQLQESYPIDPTRIHVTGFSNGAMLAYRVGAALSGKVASIAAVSGNIGGRLFSSAPLLRPPNPEHPLSVLVIHGMLDEQVPYAGGQGKKTIGIRFDISVANSVAFWRKSNHCPKEPLQQSPLSAQLHHELYQCTVTGTEVELLAIKDGGHAWPGGEVVAGWSAEKLVIRVLLDAPSDELDATQTIWRFFESHPLSPKMIPNKILSEY